MLVCSIDGHSSRSLNLVLTVHGEDGIPRPLDSRRIPRTPATAVRDVFEEWESFGGGVELIVCISADALSSDLLEGLRALARVEWVEQPDLDEVLSAWRETIPLARWLRGTMMALLASVPPPSPKDWLCGGIGDHWLQAWFSSHLEEFEQRNSVRERANETDESWLECPF